jgi:hypothetical protein
VIRYNIANLKRNILESRINRSNILSLLESNDDLWVTGYWKGYEITLPDGIELKTKYGMKMLGSGLPVKVYNKNGQYTAYKEDSPEPIELTYVLNEGKEKGR